LRARRISDNHHRKFLLHDSLIDIDNAALPLGENLSHTRDYAGMIYTKH
jgi:hypothetical protein